MIYIVKVILHCLYWLQYIHLLTERNSQFISTILKSILNLKDHSLSFMFHIMYQFHLRFQTTDYLFFMYVYSLNLLPIFIPWFLHLKLQLIQVTAFKKCTELIKSF